MKRFIQSIVLFACIAFSGFSSFGQTVLAPGDIAFVGMNLDGNDANELEENESGGWFNAYLCH